MLDQDDYDWDLPNIKLMGVFSDYREIVDGDPDVFLYTSAWDGVPTILLAIGEIGIPIVATNVGGVGEVVPQIGLVAANADAQDYIAPLQRFTASRKAFQEGWRQAIAARLKVRVFDQFCDRLASKMGSLDDRLDNHRSRTR